ncbi:MAG: hypothetical protein J6Y94_00935, partial [Bacteriovoracaceae bacterium]|nr:hypothetical protein [Bacteriovoracaceae bacterium]
MRLENITLPFNINLPEFMATQFKGLKFRVLRKSLDARRANRGRVPVYHYQVQVGTPDEFGAGKAEAVFALAAVPPLKTKVRPIIVGTGPAGLWAALRMISYGVRPLILEAGDPVGPRSVQIARCWRYGE